MSGCSLIGIKVLQLQHVLFTATIHLCDTSDLQTILNRGREGLRNTISKWEHTVAFYICMNIGMTHSL